MDAQCKEAYLALINTLLTSAGEELKILAASQDLIDDDSMRTLEKVAVALADEGNQDAADWLRSLASELSAGKKSSVELAAQQEDLDFLMEVLLTTEESSGDSEIVYSLLEKNLEKLDENFALLLQYWAEATLLEIEHEEAYGIAATVGNFSFLILQFPLDKQADNIEIAIAGYKVASAVITREVSPEEWATIHNTLGVAYLNRIYGNRAENLESALFSFQSALQVRTLEELPQQWAESQNNLGSTYKQRICGDYTENLEAAIAAYTSALLVSSYETYPLWWAMLQDDLGDTYCDRIRGDRVQNEEAALVAFQSTLLVYTREEFPEDWARIQNNLATLYSDRFRGDRGDNVELAIRACENALQIYTPDKFPEDWAMVQTNLGAAYRVRVRGDFAENIEIAIRCYNSALEVHSRECFPEDWAGLQNNLGNAHRERIEGDCKKNLEKSLCYFKAALEIYTRESLPQDWAMIQHNLALTYYELGQIEKAFACFRTSLEICTPTAFPTDCLQYAGNFGDKAFAAGRWAETIEGYGVAIEAIEQTRTWVKTEERRQEMLQEDIDLYENIVQACVNSQQLNLAIEYVERSRSRRLVDLMASNDLYQNGEIALEAQEYLQQFEAIQQEIDIERLNQYGNGGREINEAKVRTRQNITFTSKNRAALEAFNEIIAILEAKKQQVWQKLRQLDPVLAGQIQVSAPNFALMQQLVDKPTTVILSFYSTGESMQVFVLRHNQITCHTCKSLNKKVLQDWIKKTWLQPYLTNKDVWKSQFGVFLPELAKLLDLDNLISQHLFGIQEIIIIPHLYLHQIPFAALPIGDAQYLGDKFLIRYTPSCQVLEFCQKRPVVNGHLNYGIVENATEDLPCASFEGEQIAQLYNIPNNQRLRGRNQATIKNYRQLAKQVEVIVSSHHAQSRLDSPLESRLELGDGSITLGQLMTPGWRMPNLCDVFLSCCETGLGVTEITDDILTLSIGFLCAGARSVVSTLWAVDDLATALFSIFYHQYRQLGYTRLKSLQQAQVDLRTLTGQELTERYCPQLANLLEQKFEEAESDRQEAEDNLHKFPKGSPECMKWEQEEQKLAKVVTPIYNALERLESLCCEDTPFSHPFYWAAYTCSGLP